MQTYDIVIVGAGGAGMAAALNASKDPSLSVAVLSKVFPTRSHTGAAQGGMNAALAYRDPGDTVESHFFDTVKGSDYLADQDAVEFFVSGMPELVLELESMGVPYSRDEKGRIAQRPFGGASSPRCCYSADKTGHVVLHALYENCVKNGVHFLEEFNLLDIAAADGQLQGIVAIDLRNGEIVSFRARAVVIASGGFGRVYWTRTTNATNMTGDGVAACLRAGIPVKDPEFVQFHPTGLASTGVLLSEAARGEGGILVNNKGERFMERYAPDKMELGPRDLVSRSIETEIKEGRGFGEGMKSYVLIDLRHLGAEKILERLPQVRELAMNFEGVDMIEEPVPIRPSNHYMMGGIDVIDYKTCGTAIDGLHAAGECSCISVHGANRLGGNSVSEVVFFGTQAGKAAAQTAHRRQLGATDRLEELEARWSERFDALRSKSEGASLYGIRDRMAKAMWDGVGIFRDGSSMEEAEQVVDECLEAYRDVVIGDGSRRYNTAFMNYVEVGNVLQLAKTVVMGARARTETRGAHSRQDCPSRDDANFLKHTLVGLGGGAFAVDYRPVAVTKFQPQERKY
ncbi:succinate dehydrogenase [Gordonibacter sp. An230]|uniref:FAD-binding protein n=1 Tax=Gordonibacter sp. An230 TaxID=1965592 RepID=UPI000B37E5CE|nr:FAD-binding protein [Gordonibacter sp. An230]OUO88043.1 succinate dehydrogenase [Gordonibacter sp. An230]